MNFAQWFEETGRFLLAGNSFKDAMEGAFTAGVAAAPTKAAGDEPPVAMPNLDGDWSLISETLVHRLRDPIPAQALAEMPERMAEAVNVITEEAANAIESLAGQFRELEYLMECGRNAKVAATQHLNLESGLGDGGLLDASTEVNPDVSVTHGLWKCSAPIEIVKAPIYTDVFSKAENLNHEGWTIERYVLATQDATPSDAIDALSPDERELLESTIEQFADCSETDTDYAVLIDWSRRGFLECTHFEVTEKGNSAIAASAPRENTDV